jgi:hypothetical protein
MTETQDYLNGLIGHLKDEFSIAEKEFYMAKTALLTITDKITQIEKELSILNELTILTETVVSEG